MGKIETMAARIANGQDDLPMVMERFYLWTGSAEWLTLDVGYLKAVVNLPVWDGKVWKKDGEKGVLMYEAPGEMVLTAASLAWASDAEDIRVYSYNPLADDTDTRPTLMGKPEIPHRLRVCVARRIGGGYTFYTGDIKRKQFSWPLDRLLNKLRPTVFR